MLSQPIEIIFGTTIDFLKKNNTMKRINIYLPMGMLILVLLAFSCKKDEKPTVGFSMKATEATTQTGNQPLLQSGSDEILPLEWNVAWIYITHLDFRAEYYGFSDLLGKNSYPDVHIEWMGNQKVDLLANPVTFGNIELPQGNFKHFELEMTSSRFGYTGTPNFFLSGTYGPAIGGTPISVAVTRQFELELNYNGDEDISTNDAYLFEGLISVSLSHVFHGITAEELDNAELTDGWILISATQNTNLYNKILENLHTTAESSYTWSIHTIN
jgi:hypothetical protein